MDAARRTGFRDWVIQIEAGIHKQAEKENGVRPYPRNVIRRVARDVREVNPKVYCASEFSFGLFDRSPLDPEKTRADRCKLEMAKAVLEVMGKKDDYWEEFCSEVVPKPEEIQDHYDPHDRNTFSLREIQSVLTLDATFLAAYLGAIWDRTFDARFPSLKSALDRIIDLQTTEEIVIDLIKAENQIPLSLLRSVLVILMKPVEGDPDELVDGILNTICRNIVDLFCGVLPGYNGADHFTGVVSFVHCDNFLDCLHFSLMHGITKSRDEEPDRTILRGHLPSVTELQKAGIEFRGQKEFQDIVFEEGILYLPTLYLNYYSEMVWRNLVAHEQQLRHVFRGHYGSVPDFIQYIKFMDSLIDSSNDVMLLRSGKFPTIVDNSLGRDEEVANLFNTLLKYSSLETSNKWTKLRDDIYNFYKDPQRQMWIEFKDTYFGKPWLTISVVAATIILTSSVLTTAYTMALYYHP